MPNPLEAGASSARSAVGQTQPARFQELTAMLMAEYERVRHALDHALEYGGTGKLPELSQAHWKPGGATAAAPQPPQPRAPPEPGSQGSPSAPAAAAAAAAAEAVLAALAPDAWNGLDLLDSSGDAAAAAHAANCSQSNRQEEKLFPVWSEVAWQDASKEEQLSSHFLHAQSWPNQKPAGEQEESVSSGSRASDFDESSLEETDPDVDDHLKDEVRRSSKRRHSYLEDIQVTFKKGRRFAFVAFVKSPYFDYLTSLVLLTNAFVMGLQVDWSVRNSTEILPFHFRWMDWVFLACFTAELLLRLMAYGLWNFFRGPGWGWNTTDTLLVGAQMVEEVMTVVVDMGFSSDGFDVNFSAFRVLRVLRLTRLVRLVRLVRLIRELHAMVLSILSSVRSFLWACALLFLIIYVMAIFVAQSVVQMENKESLKKHTGSLPLIVFSLFQSMSGGLDWGQLAAPLVEETGFFTAVAFTVFIAFTVFVMMNVVTGVFVDAAQNSIKEEKEKDLLLRLKEAFTVMDEDNSRTLSWKEFKKQLAHPRMIDYFKAVDLDVTHARNLFTLLEMGDGTVSIDDFVFGCLRLCGPARAIDQAMTGREHTRVLKEVKTKVKALRRDIWRLSQRADRPSIVVSRINNNSSSSLSEKVS